MTRVSLEALSALPRAAFAVALGGVYEHSPWIPERAYEEAPFATLDDLALALRQVVAEAGPDEQLGLIRAHPDLAGKAALAGELSEHSSREQAGAGLDRLSPAEYARFHELNDAYKAKFGFPFVLAVKGLGKASILAAFERRLENDPEQECRTALGEIHRIARFRLETLLEAA